MVDSLNRVQALGHIRILLLNSDARMLGLEQKLLEDIGFSNILTGHDGKEGLKIMENQPVSLVITDWNMQPMNGSEFIRNVRNAVGSRNYRVPIILLTAQAEPRDVCVARDTGITEFVVMPFTVRSLTERIISVINNPRSFIITPYFKGHDRRRRGNAPPPDNKEKRKRRPRI